MLLLLLSITCRTPGDLLGIDTFLAIMTNEDYFPHPKQSAWFESFEIDQVWMTLSAFVDAFSCWGWQVNCTADSGQSSWLIILFAGWSTLCSSTVQVCNIQSELNSHLSWQTVLAVKGIFLCFYFFNAFWCTGIITFWLQWNLLKCVIELDKQSTVPSKNMWFLLRPSE